jgi:hypothetical protein
MVSHAPLQWILRTFAESFSSSSLPHFSFVRYQWRGNSVIDNTFYFFHAKVFMCWTICFLRTKLIFTSTDKFIVKTVVYGVLKTHVHCMEPHCIRLRLVFDALCREDGRDNCCKRLSRFFYSVSLLCWKSKNGLAGFSKLGRRPILRKQRLSCRAFLVIRLFGPHNPQTVRHLTSFCLDFLKIESTTITQEKTEDRKPWVAFYKGPPVRT